MKKIILFASTFILTSIGFAQINTPEGAKVPFGSNKNYDYGMLPSALPADGEFGHATEAAEAYRFWKETYVVSCPRGQYRVKFDNPAQTVSEGIAYGMVLAAYAADKDLFDGLWAYYLDNTNSNGFMHWRVNGCSEVIGRNGASDADEDAALALMVAAQQWPEADSPFVYKSDAKELVNSIMYNEVHPETYQLINGDGWGFASDCRNPSYQAPAYFKLFGEFIPKHQKFWDKSAEASYKMLQSNLKGVETGLVSNWCNPRGVPNTCNGPTGYGYDACRNPWRMAKDVIWYNDKRAKEICNDIAAYTKETGVEKVGGDIPQSGGEGHHNATFVSTFACGITGADEKYQDHFNAMYKETIKVKDQWPAYFGNTLRAISMFMMTGNFWKPEVDKLNN